MSDFSLAGTVTSASFDLSSLRPIVVALRSVDWALSTFVISLVVYAGVLSDFVVTSAVGSNLDASTFEESASVSLRSVCLDLSCSSFSV